MRSAIRIILVGRNSIVRRGVRTTLYLERDLTLLGEASHISEIQELSRELVPHLLILHLDSPNVVSPKSMILVGEQYPDLRVLAIASHSDVDISDLMENYIAGCVSELDEPRTLVNAIHQVAQGNTWYGRDTEKLVQQKLVDEASQNREVTLTEQERRILSLIAQGWCNAHIAAELKLSHQTVRNYISFIYSKLAINSRGEAIAWFVRNLL